jgi:hypothetical protein
MKESLSGLLVIVLLLLSIATAQDKPNLASDPANAQPSATSRKTLTISGKVSDDGKTLITDIDSEWNVSNAEALKGHEGSRVTAKCYVDRERDTLHVISARSEQGALRYAARRGDSAFRR